MKKIFFTLISGLYFLAADLPSDSAERDQIILSAVGRDARQIDGGAGMSAPKTWAKAPKGVKSAQWGRQKWWNFYKPLVKSRDLKINDSLSRMTVSYSDHP